MHVSDLRFEHHRDTLGIGESAPRLSWRTSEDQAAYEFAVDDGGTSWHSGRIDGTDSTYVPWPAGDLPSRTQRTVRVRAWCADGSAPSAWSAPATVETGLLEAEDWTARPVRVDAAGAGRLPRPAVLLRRAFSARGTVARARLYVTAHGLYEVELNGVRVGDQVLAPGWSSYRHRLRYQTFDVTGLIRGGDNTVGAWLADGWFRGLVGFDGGTRDLYGEHTALLAQLELTYTDGTVEVIGTDRHWRTAPGPVTGTGLYEGETHDARLEPAGWSSPGFDDSSWSAAVETHWDLERLIAPTGPPVRRIETLSPVSVTTAPSGRTIVDFGQNIAGRVRIRVRGGAGRQVRIRHAEVLEHGELCVRPLRAAVSVDTYILRDDDGVQVWEPRFTVHGFRYAEIDSDLPIDVEAVVVHTDMTPAGWFECSDPLLNRLHDNVRWSMRGNFVDLPTDCPQRDERLGWTGDIQVFAPTAAYLYDCTGMLRSWLRDLAAEQRQFGTVPHYVPWIQLGFPIVPAAAWGDAAVIVPWTLYQRTGDLQLLREQYDSMCAWVDQVAALAPAGRWDSGFQFGDWLDPAAPPENPAEARTDRYLVATAYHAHTAQILADTAGLLGDDEAARRYGDLAAAVRAAFNDEFVAPTGRLVSDSQTAHALALRFGLLPKPEQRQRAGQRLVELVRAARYRIATGFVGTPLICDALSAAGAHDVAYHLLTQQELPSWLYPVTMDATTVWERWDSMLPDGAVNPGDMTSFNHYALGAVADWLHRTVAGLAPAAPGYRRLLVAPRPGGGLTRASATHDTPHGRAEVRWHRDGGRLTVAVLVPSNTVALVHLPDPATDPVEIGAGRHTFQCAFRPAADDPPLPTFDRYGNEAPPR
jgi:alpha-L-rhamnosidase